MRKCAPCVIRFCVVKLEAPAQLKLLHQGQGANRNLAVRFATLPQGEGDVASCEVLAPGPVVFHAEPCCKLLVGLLLLEEEALRVRRAAGAGAARAAEKEKVTTGSCHPEQWALSVLEMIS